MNNINTFLIGAQKAGTTSLYDWLGQHPDIFAPSEIKDYHYFSNESIFKKGDAHINSFYRKNKNSIRLHAGVNYMYFYEKAAKRIFDYSPDAKIIICLRNPVARAISAYKYFKRTLRENNSFDEALKVEKSNKVNMLELSNRTYVGHGRYLEQIEGFMKYFKKGQVLFLYFEELMDVDRQQSILNKVTQFLEVSNFNFNFTHLNKSATPKYKWLNSLIREDYVLKKIKIFFPNKFIKKFLKIVEEKNISDSDMVIDISEYSVKLLEKEFLNEKQELSLFLKKDLNALWKF